MNLIEAFKQAVRDSGQTLYRVAKGSRISYPVVLRFMSGQRGLTLETASKLAEYLGLELRPRRPKSRRRAKRPS